MLGAVGLRSTERRTAAGGGGPCGPAVAGLLQGCCRAVARLLQGCCKAVAGLLQAVARPLCGQNRCSGLPGTDSASGLQSLRAGPSTPRWRASRCITPVRAVRTCSPGPWTACVPGADRRPAGRAFTPRLRPCQAPVTPRRPAVQRRLPAERLQARDTARVGAGWRGRSLESAPGSARRAAAASRGGGARRRASAAADPAGPRGACLTRARPCPCVIQPTLQTPLRCILLIAHVAHSRRL